jgi:hypothetical protein
LGGGDEWPFYREQQTRLGTNTSCSVQHRAGCFHPCIDIRNETCRTRESQTNTGISNDLGKSVPAETETDHPKPPFNTHVDLTTCLTRGTIPKDIGKTRTNRSRSTSGFYQSGLWCEQEDRKDHPKAVSPVHEGEPPCPVQTKCV